MQHLQVKETRIQLKFHDPYPKGDQLGVQKIILLHFLKIYSSLFTKTIIKERSTKMIRTDYKQIIKTNGLGMDYQHCKFHDPRGSGFALRLGHISRNPLLLIFKKKPLDLCIIVSLIKLLSTSIYSTFSTLSPTKNNSLKYERNLFQQRFFLGV